jgi:hypothetical protein
MISPASGIHRPSYSGAPAIQTMTGLLSGYVFLAVRSEYLRFNVCGGARIAQNARL